jgi:hypothetical protein
MPATLKSEPPVIPGESEALDYLMPLVFFYRDGLPMPPIEFIAGSAMPEPQRHLLVHASDMTPRLREHHQSPIALHVHHKEEASDYLLRVVVLSRESDARPVEFGAIGIRLDSFNPFMRRDIRTGSAPLGTILERERFPHSSHPRAYFQVNADAFIAKMLHCEPGTRLYGRCNELHDGEGYVFADIVEILPPA